MNEIHKIYSYLGGSHAYGLNNENSDRDERGVFLNTKKSEIFGLETHEHQENKVTDTFYFELRNFLKLARKGNTQVLEALFNTNHILTTDQFNIIKASRRSLLDSETIFKTLRGYSQGEKNIIIGANTGKLGEKRKSAIEKYGYSYRNVVHCLRLLRCGIIFFQTDNYPVNIVEGDKELGPLIKDIKNNPGNHKLPDLLEEITRQDELLKKSFDDRATNYEFDVNIAAEICNYCYKPFLV